MRDDHVTRDAGEPASAFLPLRPVEFLILLSLVSGERHGYGIIQDAHARYDAFVPGMATTYRALRRLRDQGLIAAMAHADASEAPDASEERRIHYRLTPRGLRVARAEARRMEVLTRAARHHGLLQP